LFTAVLKFCFEVAIISKSFCSPSGRKKYRKSQPCVLLDHIYVPCHTHTY